LRFFRSASFVVSFYNFLGVKVVVLYFCLFLFCLKNNLLFSPHILHFAALSFHVLFIGSINLANAGIRLTNTQSEK